MYFSGLCTHSPNAEEVTAYSAFVNGTSTTSICLDFYSGTFEVRSSLVLNNTQQSSSAGLICGEAGAVVALLSCIIRGNSSPRYIFDAMSGSLTVIDCCYDVSTRSGAVTLGSSSVCVTVIPLQLLSAGLCSGSGGEAADSVATQKSKGASCLFGRNSLVFKVPPLLILFAILSHSFPSFLSWSTSFP
jgi:hypothetical protein